MRDLKAELDTWDGQYGEPWNPEPGETLVGTLQAYSRGQTRYGMVNIANLIEEETSRKIAVWLSSTVLLDLFKQQHPKRGERLAIRYYGKHEEKGYRRYRLLIDRDETQSLQALGGEEYPPLDPPEENGENPFTGREDIDPDIQLERLKRQEQERQESDEIDGDPFGPDTATRNLQPSSRFQQKMKERAGIRS